VGRVPGAVGASQGRCLRDPPDRDAAALVGGFLNGIWDCPRLATASPRSQLANANRPRASSYLGGGLNGGPLSA